MRISPSEIPAQHMAFGVEPSCAAGAQSGEVPARERSDGIPKPLDDLRRHLIGTEELVPTIGGGLVRYVNADNAATTPAMWAAWHAVEALVPHHSSVHRGSGYKARVCTRAYEEARRVVGEFVGADPERDTVVFTKNTTEAINTLASDIELPDGAVVLTTVLEHHSNDLPWRARARTLHVGAGSDGSLDLDHLDALLARHAGRVALLVVTGASNVTGVVQPVHEHARRVHAVGGRILVDAAQLAAHRPVDLLPHDDPGHLDFVALSGHKLYAPFGSGALIGRRDAFALAPRGRGGGTVTAVSLDDVAWADLPDREEAGTPNLFGAVAFAAAAATLRAIGWDRVMVHESALLETAMNALLELPRVRVYGPTGTRDPASKVPVLPFNVEGVDHALVAAVLGFEHGIGVRSGCFCAQPYVAHLLGLDPVVVRTRLEAARRGARQVGPGMVRVSLGLGNGLDDVERIVTAVGRIADGRIIGRYRRDERGEYQPAVDD